MQAGHILLIEDKHTHRKAIQDMLHTLGHRAEAVETGEHGLKCVHENAFDVVLSDVGLPDMDGIELIGHIRDTDPTVVPLVMADQYDHDTVIRAMETGAQGFFNKPICPNKLETRLQKALEERKQRVETRGLIRDLILLRTSLREKMIEREHFLDHVLDAAPFGILTTGKDNRIITMNRKAEQIYGYAYEDMAGCTIDTLCKPIQPDAQSPGFETRHTRKNGETFPVRLKQRDITNQQDEEIARLYLVEDISENELMEAQLLYAERLSTLGQLAPRIAHEFKSPLQIIMGNVELARYHCESNNLEKATGSIDKIPQAVQNLLKLVEQISHLGRPSRGRHECVDLGHQLRQLVETLNPLGIIKYCDINWQCHPDTPPIYGDPDQIDQVFRNLIVNAAQAMENEDKRVLTIATASDGNHARVEIGDTGPGIPREIVDEIFQPFFSTKPEGKGTGLGLSIVKTVLDRCNAACQIETDEGQGTKFILLFPASS